MDFWGGGAERVDAEDLQGFASLSKSVAAELQAREDDRNAPRAAQRGPVLRGCVRGWSAGSLDPGASQPICRVPVQE